MKKGLKRTKWNHKRTLTNDFLHLNGANFFVQFYFEFFHYAFSLVTSNQWPTHFSFTMYLQEAFNGCDLLFRIIDGTRHAYREHLNLIEIAENFKQTIPRKSLLLLLIHSPISLTLKAY